MTAIERIAKKYRPIKELDCDMFVNPDGKCYALSNGQEHYIACKNAGTSLKSYLQAGGLRVKFGNSVFAIEYVKKLTDNQVIKLKQIIRKNIIDYLIISNGQKEQTVIEYNGIKQRHLLQLIK